MRILLVTNLYPPQELGGYGRCMSDFCWGLQRLGHHVAVLTSDAPYLGPGLNGPNGEPVERALQLKGSFENGINQINDPSACTRINQGNQLVLHQRLRKGWDGVLVGNLDLLGNELLPPLLQAGIPVLHHVGFVHPPYPAQHYPNQSHYTVLSASHAVRQQLIAAGFPLNNAPVVYPGAREDLLGSTASGRPLPEPLNGWIPLPERLGTSQHPLKVCFAGLLMNTKGAHTFVDALILLKQRGLQIQATLAGSSFQPGYQVALQALLAQHALEGVVQFTGNLQRPQLARMLRLHQVGVFPSIHPEAFGIVGAEMQMSGLALVSSGVGGAAELVHHNHTGLRFQPGQAIDLANQLQQLADDPALLRRLARAGQQQAHDRFSVKQSCRELEILLQNG